MKKALIILLITVLFIFTACGSNAYVPLDDEGYVQAEPQQLQQEPQPEPDIQSEPEPESLNTGDEDDMFRIEIIVGNKTFDATLYETEAAKALVEQLPMTIDMSELNGNEKYYYLDNSLPTDSGRPPRINTGDLMLYGSSCLVLFYYSFSTTYSYTPLGYIDNPEGLASALGNGDVQVTFQ